MVPVVLLIVGGVLLVLAALVYAYRSHTRVHVSGDSDDEDDDNDLASEYGVRPTAETAALMDGEVDSLNLKPTPLRRSVQADDLTLVAYLVSLVRRGGEMKQKKAPLMHRRNNGVKKIHKPYFYPLLDETAQWYADWESKKQQTSNPASEKINVRIDKPSPDATASVSPRDLLDGLDCVSLVSIRSSSHTVLPVAVI